MDTSCRKCGCTHRGKCGSEPDHSPRCGGCASLRTRLAAAERELATERAAHDATRAALDAARAEAERMRGALNETADLAERLAEAVENGAGGTTAYRLRQVAREALAALAPRDATPATSCVPCPACHGAGFVPGGAG